MDRRIGREGASGWVICSQRRQDFFWRATSTSFSFAAIRSRISADILAEQAQGAAALRAVLARVEHDALARGLGRDKGLAAAQLGRSWNLGRRRVRSSFHRLLFGGHFVCVAGLGHPEVLERQFQLLDLALDLLRAGAVPLPLEPGNLQTKRLDQSLMRTQRGFYRCDVTPQPRDRPLSRRSALLRGDKGCLRCGVFRQQCHDHRLQGGWVVGQSGGASRHAPAYHGNAKKPINKGISVP